MTHLWGEPVLLVKIELLRHLVRLDPISADIDDHVGSLGAESCEPPQRTQARHEQILAATHGDESRQTLEAAPDRRPGNRENAVAFVVPDEWILLGSVTDEIAVGRPLRLHELELPLQMCTDQKEDTSALGAVLLQYALWQGRPIVGAAPQEVVEIDVDNVILQGIAWIDTTNVRTEGTLQSLHVIGVGENIVAVPVTSELRVVTLRRKHQ